MSSTQLTTPQAVHARARTRSARTVRALPDAPWTRGDGIVTAAVIALGVLLVLISWLGASDTTDWDTQMAWTALSMAGVVVVCLGVGIWLFRAARLSPITPTPTDVIRSDRVTVAGMAHHHAPGCLLVRGKITVAADESVLQPCGVCA